MKTTNRLRVATLLLCAALTMTGCTSNFDSINTNYNNPTSATCELLLMPIMRTLIQGQFNYGDGASLAHYVSLTNYNEIQQYSFDDNESAWNSFYLQLANIQELYDVATEDDLPSCQAISYIWKAFTIAQITDLWGDVPFSEATLGADNVTPAYDYQEDIYTADGGIIDLLKQAEELLNSSNDVIPTDIVYSGDREKWRKFGNSLRLRYLMRISNRIGDSSMDIAGEIADVMSLPLMESNDDNMELPYLADSDNESPIYSMRSGNFDYYRMSTEMERMWTEWADPRIPVYFSPTTNSASTDTPTYAGVLAGCSSTTLTALGYNESDVSQPGSYYRDTQDGCSAILMNCSEALLLQAEAVARGYASGDAQSLYEAGIETSMDYYGVSLTDDYLAQSGVAYSSDDAIELIMRQKWMAMFFVGYQAWFEFLRTGLPEQDEIGDNRNPTASGEVPSRFYYPSDEQALNPSNYQEAVSRYGDEDDINTELWWE